MEKIKVYSVVCSYYAGEKIDIELSDMLERLHLEPEISFYETKYDILGVVLWGVKNGYKTRYLVKSRWVDFQSIERLQKNKPFSFYIYEERAYELALELTMHHDRFIINMSEEELQKIFKNYGNDYCNQTKKGRYF